MTLPWRPAPLLRAAGAAAAIGITCVWAYRHSLSAGFLSDDHIILSHFTQKGGTVWGLWYPLFVRPLTAWTWLADIRVYGIDDARGHHLTNLLLHLAATGLLWVLARQWRDLPKGAPLIAAAMFALLPGHSEAVSWITGRCDVLAALWASAALIAHRVHRRRGDPRAYALSLLFYACMLMTKESAVVFPLILITDDLLERRAGRSSSPGLIPWAPILMAGAYFVLRWVHLGHPIAGYGNALHLNFDPGTIWRSLWSAPLMMFFGAQDLAYLQSWQRPLLALIGAALIALCALTSGAAAGRSILGCLGLALLAQLPTINFRFTVGSPENERLLYWPSMFVCLACAGAISGTLKTVIVRRLAVCALLLYLVSRLDTADRDWLEAQGVATRTLQAVLSQAAGSDVLLLNVPDNHRGRYVLRNGLQQIIGRYGRGRIHVEGVVGALDVSRKELAVKYTVADQRLSLRAVDGSEVFGGPYRTWGDPRTYTDLTQDARHLGLKLTPRARRPLVVLIAERGGVRAMRPDVGADQSPPVVIARKESMIFEEGIA